MILTLVIYLSMSGCSRSWAAIPAGAVFSETMENARSQEKDLSNREDTDTRCSFGRTYIVSIGRCIRERRREG